MTSDTTLFAGARTVEGALAGTPGEDLARLVGALEQGDWADATLDVLGAGAALGVGARDPAGALAGAGVGWALEHLGPLTACLDELAGDPDQVLGEAAALRGLSAELGLLAEDLRADAGRALGGQHGRTVDAYHGALRETAAQVDQAGASLTAVASALERASVLVEAVRAFVVGIVSEVVGRLVARMVVAATGVGTAVLAAAFTADVASGAVRARRAVNMLLGCLETLRTSLRHLARELAGIAAHAVRRQVRPAPRRRGVPRESLAGRLTRLGLPSAADATANGQRREVEDRARRDGGSVQG